MTRINLLPPEERASIRAVETKAILLAIGLLIGGLMAFTAVYLRMQVNYEQSEIVGYKETMASMGEFRVSIARLEKEIQTIQEQMKPLESAIQEITPLFNTAQLLSRVASSAQQGNVWLQDLTLQGGGGAPINGFAVDFTELNRFITAIGSDPYKVNMGSQSWDVRGGVRVVVFSAHMGTKKPITTDSEQGGKTP